ncbi:MAG TPA: Uma2 family endonuclease, partial [Aggregatilineales bacterium]|nr:Uma2 family endonuclease [Aggregatilineales bacterium]
KTNNLGFAFPDGCGYVLSKKRIVIPDVSFVAKSRLILPLPKLLPLAPDLAVEIISPSEKEMMVFEKARTYLLHGTKIVWVVFPDNKSVYVCTSATDDSLNVKIYDATMTLSGGDVLPNFSLPVADIFPEDEA